MVHEDYVGYVIRNSEGLFYSEGNCENIAKAKIYVSEKYAQKCADHLNSLKLGSHKKDFKVEKIDIIIIPYETANKAYWIDKGLVHTCLSELELKYDSHYEHECSRCGYIQRGYTKTKYCPNCGSFMEDSYCGTA